MDTPLISIIVPTFNRAKIIGETLDSIKNQTYQNWECLVIDDGSTDDTELLLSTYIDRDNRFQFHKRPVESPKGANACRNYGFEISEGVFIQWFDSDDIMLPENLALKRRFLESNPLVDFVVCQGANIGAGDQKPTIQWNFKNTGNLLLNHIRGMVVFGTNGPMFNRSYLDGKKLFDETLTIRQEWEFFSRLLMDDPTVGFLEKVLYHYKTFKSGIRRNNTYGRLKGIISAERRLLNIINKKQPFSTSDDYTYRKSSLNRVKKHLPVALKKGRIRAVFFLIGTFLLTLNFTFVKTGLKRLLKR